MSKREVEQPPLSDYPLNRAGGNLELVDAETIYKWDDHYWLAILVVDSKYKTTSRSVRIYRWKWGDGRWKLDLKTNINKKSQWDDIKRICDKFFEEYM